MKKYCGVVVWFYPDDGMVKNILTYIRELDRLYVIDNSEKNNFYLLEENNLAEKCDYVFLGCNTGLAHALNIGCEKAIADGYKFILTMDQDSWFEEGAKSLIDYMEVHQGEISLVCPNVKSLYLDDKSGEEKVAYLRWDKDEYRELNWTMTSGSLMSLDWFYRVGGFDESMFIAHLDIDLCIRIHQIGGKIVMVGCSVLCQRFGNSKPKKFLWKTVHPSFATPVRTYYLFRNQKYLEKKYGKSIRKWIGVSLWKFVVKVTCFEEDKLEKYKMMFRGCYDAKVGNMGAYGRK